MLTMHMLLQGHTHLEYPGNVCKVAYRESLMFRDADLVMRVLLFKRWGRYKKRFSIIPHSEDDVTRTIPTLFINLF